MCENEEEYAQKRGSVSARGRGSGKRRRVVDEETNQTSENCSVEGEGFGQIGMFVTTRRAGAKYRSNSEKEGPNKNNMIDQNTGSSRCPQTATRPQ